MKCKVTVMYSATKEIEVEASDTDEAMKKAEYQLRTYMPWAENNKKLLSVDAFDFEWLESEMEKKRKRNKDLQEKIIPGKTRIHIIKGSNKGRTGLVTKTHPYKKYFKSGHFTVDVKWDDGGESSAGSNSFEIFKGRRFYKIENCKFKHIEIEEIKKDDFYKVVDGGDPPLTKGLVLFRATEDYSGDGVVLSRIIPIESIREELDILENLRYIEPFQDPQEIEEQKEFLKYLLREMEK